MLKDFITSRVRIKLLQLFLQKPDAMYHVREIVRKTNEEINAVRRELMHMEHNSMLSKEKRGNRLYYIFRKTYPLYFELLELVAKTSGLGGSILKLKMKLGKIKFAMLSGKYVRQLQVSSDNVDLLVVGSVVLPELAQIVRTAETERSREINYTVMTEEEFNFRKKRRDPFILNVIQGSRLMIVGDEEELVNI